MPVSFDGGIVGYFQGTATGNFTIPQAGDYVLFDCFQGIFHRTANDVITLKVLVDGTEQIVYRWATTDSDLKWGDSRRSITGTQRKLTLSAGDHKITTQGNLYYDATYYPTFHEAFLLRVK